MGLPDPRTVTYSPTQLEQYFQHISFPLHKQRKLQSLSTVSGEEQLQLLTCLQQYQLAAVPFENLEIHYTYHRSIDLHPTRLFKKIVDVPKSRCGGTANLRGGYCMENNQLFATVLKSLGYQVATLGARVFEPDLPAYGGWNHMVLGVYISGVKYLVDVGFGGAGLVAPLMVENGFEMFNIAPARARLVRKKLDEHVGFSQMTWVYQYSRGTEQQERSWLDIYCFGEDEFMPRDFEMMSYFVSTHRSSLFTHRIVMIKFLLDIAPELGLSAEARREHHREVGQGMRQTYRQDRSTKTQIEVNRAETSGAEEKEEEEEEEGEEEEGEDDEPVIVGTLILTNNVKRRIRSSESERLEPDFETEEQRIKAIDRWFRIDLGEDARNAIRGTASEIAHREM